MPSNYTELVEISDSLATTSRAAESHTVIGADSAIADNNVIGLLVSIGTTFTALDTSPTSGLVSITLSTPTTGPTLIYAPPGQVLTFTTSGGQTTKIVGE